MVLAGSECSVGAGRFFSRAGKAQNPYRDRGSEKLTFAVPWSTSDLSCKADGEVQPFRVTDRGT